MRISIIGTGYVGLVSGVCFADAGIQTVCIDNNESKVANLHKGIIPIYEPGVEEILKKIQANKTISFSTDIKDAVDGVDVIFLALPTPEDEDGSANLKYVLDVAESLGKIITKYTVIVNKSTVPVGTSDLVSDRIRLNYTGEFDVVSNPEFLREGTSVEDFNNPERIIIGTKSDRAFALMSELYKPFIKNGAPILQMDEKSAEVAKYAANSFLATKITFMNEIANLCDKVGANVDNVKNGIGYDSRIGHKFLNAGLGFGGGCFPKDVKALHKSAKDNNYTFEILDAVMKVNQNQRVVFFDKVEKEVPEIESKTFAMWGLTFKPNTDDIREAPALDMIQKLLLMGATVKVFDPKGMDNVKKIYGDKLVYCADKYEASCEADVLIISTEWTEFKNADKQKMKEGMKGDMVFDGRNIFEVEAMKSMGFKYFSVGRC